MWTKIKGFIQAAAGTILVLAVLLILAAFGVLMMFVGYFLFWGILGICIMFGIAFLIYAAVTES
jgi:hypothetical protein